MRTSPSSLIVPNCLVLALVFGLLRLTLLNALKLDLRSLGNLCVLENGEVEFTPLGPMITPSPALPFLVNGGSTKASVFNQRVAVRWSMDRFAGKPLASALLPARVPTPLLTLLPSLVFAMSSLTGC